MADQKISQMTNATALTGVEILPAVQSSINVQTTINALSSYLTLPISFSIVGIPTTAQVYNWVTPLAVTIPANFAGTTSYCQTLPTSNATFIVNKISDGMPIVIGTLTITSASHTSCVLSVQNAITLSRGDVIQLVAPIQDTTLADVSITILGTLFDPSLDLNFLTGTLDSRITFTRASTATYFDVTGTLQTTRFNSIRNSMIIGAVAGSPGTLPTNWNDGGINLLTRTIALGVENGISYIDVTISGTPNASSWYYINFDTITQTTAQSGQTWTASFYVYLLAGSGAVSNQFKLSEFDAGSGWLAQSANSLTGIAPPLISNRQIVTRTLNQATTAFVQSSIYIGYTSGVAINLTFRIGAPQLEIGATASTFIPTSSTALGAPRFDYDPVTHVPLGLLIEEQRINSIRNNTMVGAVAGTPGTLPTNWSLVVGGGITTNVVGVGVVGGVNYVDVRVYGTTASVFWELLFDTTTGIAAVTGQTWTETVYIAMIAGSTANLTAITVGANENNSSGTALIADTPINILTSISSTLIRQTAVFTTSNAATAFVCPFVGLNFNNGVVIDITIRIGLPQLELGSFATSPILTTSTAVTRSADVATLPTSPWFNPKRGTVIAEGIYRTIPVTQNTELIGIGTDSNNLIRMIIGLGGTTLNSQIFSGGVNELTLWPSTTLTGGVVVKTGFTYDTPTLAVTTLMNGNAVSSGTAQAFPNFSTMWFGTGRGQPLNGYIRHVRYWPAVLAASDLQRITTLDGPSLDLNFTLGQSLDPRIIFSRAAGPAIYIDSTGTLQTAATNIPRFDYDPTTLLPRGLLIEEARTNSIRNSTMIGATAGTPGTMPTNWAYAQSSALALSWQVVATGVENGISYIDWRVYGTPAASGSFAPTSEGNTTVVAGNGQAWTASQYMRVVAGSLINVGTCAITIVARDASGINISSGTGTAFVIPSGSLATTRQTATYSTTNALTAFINFIPWITVTNGLAINVTLRIGAPQLELGAFATSFIPTASAAVIRHADYVSMLIGSWYNPSQGTLYTEASWNGALGFPRVVQLDDGTNNNLITHLLNTGGNAIYSNATVAGVTQWNISSATFAIGTVFKQGTAFASNSADYAVNGVLGTHDSIATIPAVTTMHIGVDAGGTVTQSMLLRRVRYWRRPMLAAELQAITT